MASGVVVNSNIPSVHAARVLSKNRDSLETAMARLSSGRRINSAADDAAAASVAGKMRADIKSTDVAVRNISDGISLWQTYDGAASEVESLLHRMRELSTQMTNSTYASADRTAADVEYQALLTEIDLIANGTQFNRTAIANAAVSVTVQAGPGTTAANDQITISTASLLAADIKGAGADALLDTSEITTAAESVKSLKSIDLALAKVASARATAGSAINRLSFALSNAQNVSQRLKEAISGLEDTDYAAESANLAKGMVLAQAGTAMLAQANQAPQYVLALLRT